MSEVQTDITSPSIQLKKSCMKVTDFLRPELVIANLRATSKPQVLGEMATHVSETQTGIDAGRLRKVLEDRELLASTAIGDGIAIPHGKLEAVPQLLGVLGRSQAGLEFDSIDGKPTHLVFMLVAPTNSAGAHLKALARLSRLFRDAMFRQKLLEASDAAAMYDVICEEDAKY